MQNEIWKDVKDYESLYQVSNFGRVRRLDAYIINKNGNKIFVKGGLRKLKNQDEYLTVPLTKNNKPKYFRVHRLVAEAFISNPDNKPIVNHKDRNRKNNYVDNLEWVTEKENSIHAIETLPQIEKTLKEKTMIPFGSVETWKDIRGYEKLYQVSNFGNVKRLASSILSKHNIICNNSERLLKPFLYKNKNYAVKLTKGSKSKSVYLHRLVAEAFIPNPDNKPFVRHIDGYIDNNIVLNLKWVNPSDISTLRFFDTKTPEFVVESNSEVWKDIVGFEGYYQISNYGRIRSKTRIITDKLNREVLYKGRLLKLKVKNDYSFVCLSINSKKKDFPVHRLVAEAFIPNPENKPFVNHINSIRTDNHIKNLEWATPKENAEHMSKMDRAKSKKVWQYDLKGNFIQEFPSAIKAAKYIKVHYTVMQRTLSDEKSRFCANYQWKYADDSFVINIHKDAREKTVLQYSLDGKYIQTFDSLVVAVNYLKENGFPDANPANLSKACTGVRNYSYNFQWRYEDDKTSVVPIRQRSLPIVQLSKEKFFIKRFETIREAEDELGLKHDYSGISKCCRGVQQSAHGFIWMYEEEYEKTII